jgi:hypothetical protein
VLGHGLLQSTRLGIGVVYLWVLSCIPEAVWEHGCLFPPSLTTVVGSCAEGGLRDSVL